MTNSNPNLRQTFQRLLEQSNEIAGQLTSLQLQIDQLQTQYLERTWPDGNVHIGWKSNSSANRTTTPNFKIYIDPKQKCFSLSSVSSIAYSQIGVNVDRQLSPYAQQRFESNKKQKSKKGRAQTRRIRPIRKIRSK